MPPATVTEVLRKYPTAIGFTRLQGAGYSCGYRKAYAKFSKLDIPTTCPLETTSKACGALLCEGEIHQRLLVAT